MIGALAIAKATASLRDVRLDDAGMGVQMAEYVSHAVLRYFRRFDEYAMQQAAGQWRFLKPHDKRSFTVGILGLGILGSRSRAGFAQCGCPGCPGPGCRP